MFSLRDTVSHFLAFESALAMAQAECGVIPVDAAQAIAAAAARIDAEGGIDLAALEAATERTGYPVAPFVRQLTAACGDAGRWLHWGATTQDLMLTTRARQMALALVGIEQQVRDIIATLARHADAHRATVMAGRGFGGHALPISFGLKCAHWLAPFVRHARRLASLRAQPVEGEFAGAMGTLASLHPHGPAVQAALMRRLGLAVPLASASSARDQVAQAVGLLALVCASAGKTAHDLTLMTHTEVAEIAEPVSGGKDTSSTLPHKANPIYSWQAITAAAQVRQAADAMLGAMGHEHERSGQGFTEAQVVPQAFIAARRCLERLHRVLDGMRIDAARMRANLDATAGLVVAERVQMALAPSLGRLAAHDSVHAACQRALRQGRPLAAVLKADPSITAVLDAASIDELLDPAGYLGAHDTMIDRVLDAVRGLPAPQPIGALATPDLPS